MSFEFRRFVKQTTVATLAFSPLIPLLLVTRDCGGNKSSNYIIQAQSREVVQTKSTGVPNIHFIESLPKNNCASYVRIMAKDKFGKNFTNSNAWDRRYNDVSVASVDGTEGLITKIEQSLLDPGMVIGIYYDNSNYLNHLDQTGKKVRYTHNVLYLGWNDSDGNGRVDENEVHFAHQFGRKQETFTLNEMAEKNFTPMEILDSKN